MEFSELYRYLLFKSVAYSLCEGTIDKLRYVRGKLQELKGSVSTAHAGFLYWFKEVEQFVENAEELREAIHNAERVWMAQPLQGMEVEPKRAIAVMEEFVKEYEGRLRTFRSLVPQLDFGALRKYGVPPLLCDEPAIYVSAAGKLVFPRFRGGLKWDYKYSDAYDFKETLRLILSIKKRARIEYVRFYFAHDHRGVAYNQEDKVVAIPVDQYAEEINDHVGVQILKSCFD